jgi:cell fate regulator YaaT (PSP1 superfamily)
MRDLVEVAFKGNRREFFLWDDVATPPGPPTSVIVEGDRGEDLGTVHAAGPLAEQRFVGVPHGAALGDPTRRVIRTATRDEIRRALTLADENDKARRAAIQQVKALELQMKVTDADWQFDRRKLTLYFTAEKRVDFRVLVKELASTFRARIELKQIGVRDEAKRLDGIGRCGRQYCSASWLPDLRPVNLGVAKDQKLSLNPTQISGACGRLMCCLRYEHEFYVQSRRKFPKEGKLLETTLGDVKILANDIFRERISVRTPDGEVQVFPLAELRRLSTNWPAQSDDVPTSEDEGVEGIVDDAPRAATHTRMPESRERRLDVVSPPRAPRPPRQAPTVSEPPRVVAPPTPPPVAAALTPTVAAADDADDDVDDGADDGTDGEAAAGDAVATDASAQPRKSRRRRGRRGGRRGRGDRTGGTSSDAAPPPAAD